MLDLPSAFLTLPASDSSWPRLVRKVRLLALRRLLTWPLDGLPPTLRSALIRLRPVLTDTARRHPAATLSAIGAPDVLPRLLSLAHPQVDAIAQLAAVGPDLLAALPARALTEAILWDHPAPGLSAPRLGFAIDAPLSVVVADPSGLSLALADGTRLSVPPQDARRPYHPLHPDLPRLHLSTRDTNPLSMLEDHPDKAGNAVSLGGKAATEWVAALSEALALIAVALPEWWRELPLSLERLVPVGFEAEMHLSASYLEAPGVAWMTLHPDPLTLAEAIVHETQHSRLNTLMWLDPVLKNGRSEWTASPVRPDLRPLSGVLLAAHAFVPVAAMHARLEALGHPISQTPHFRRRRDAVLESNARGLATVAEKGQPTAAGRRLLAGLHALHVVCSTWNIAG
ncbi:MAG: HEXXH motif-containing protein [Myxococcota bacterium]|jgi:HEXXH motif-containing protein